MKSFVFRNNTIEFFFNNNECDFSGYDDISLIPQNYDNYIWFYQVPYDVINEASVEKIKSYIQKFDFVYSQLPESKEILVFTLANIIEISICSGDFSYKEALNAFNRHIIELSQIKRNIKVLDFNDFVSQYKKDDFIDWKYYFSSQIPFNPKLATDLKKWFAYKKNEIALKRKKCIVLDLDNTVWGGVLGEDGVEGIKIGGDYPGKAFLYFQKALVQLSQAGIILAVCSKNNEKDVKECWKNNPYNIINEKYISSYRINWNNKADNIKEIAKELNIGLDSLVFVDDTPTERELIKQTLPMVEVPDFPEHPYDLPMFIQNLISNCFRVYELTEEDKKKTEEYKANALRSNEQVKYTDLDSFIKSLEIKLTIQNANKMNISRVAQMTQKTNQFNLTTKRYTENDLNELLSDGAKIWCLSVSDRFGDSGITGAIIVKNNEIDEFLLSCRILGKKIENAFINKMLKILKDKGFIELSAKYLPTQKNALVKDFYEQNGFSIINNTDKGEKYYKINLQRYEYKNDDKYKIIVMEE